MKAIVQEYRGFTIKLHKEEKGYTWEVLQGKEFDAAGPDGMRVISSATALRQAKEYIRTCC